MKDMRNIKIMCSMMFVGLMLLAAFSMSAYGKTYYESHCMEWGNKYLSSGQYFRFFAKTGEVFGFVFHCTETKTVNKINLFFKGMSNFVVGTEPHLTLSTMNTTTGLPKMDSYGGVNISIKWNANWNSYIFDADVTFYNDSYYYVVISDIHRVFDTRTPGRSAYVPICDSSSSSMFARGSHMYYEPFEGCFNFIGTTVSSGINKYGSIPWYIENTTVGLNSIEGNIYDTYSAIGGSLFGSFVIRQTFIPDKDMNCTSLSIPFALVSSTKLFPGDNIYINITEVDTSTVLFNSTILNKNDTLQTKTPDGTYNLGRFYSLWFDDVIYLKQGFTYNITFSSPLSSVSNFMSVCLVSTLNNSLRNLTFNGITGYYSSSYNGGTSWTKQLNYDIPFVFSVINDDFILPPSSCNSTNLTVYENLINVSGAYFSYYDPLTGWIVYNNYTGNISYTLRNITIHINLSGMSGSVTWSGFPSNQTNITDIIAGNTSYNGTVDVNDDYYFLSGILSFEPSVMILSLFSIFFFIGYESKKRSGGFFMIFAGFLLIALGVLIYGTLGYASALVVPFAVFIMLLGGKKAFYGPESEESQSNK